MRHFKFLLLTLISLQCSEAKTTNIIMPESIQTQLCQKLSERGCSSEEQLRVKESFKLDNDQLLLFFYLYKPNAIYHHGYTNIPVLVDMEGKWQVINSHMDGEIEEIGRDLEGGIWVRTLWMIEGVSPTLYYSKDGIKWIRITFPSKRAVNSTLEDVTLCFLEKEILLTFKSLGGDEVVKAWKTDYKDAISKQPHWKRISQKEICQQSCFKTSAYNNAWKKEESQENLDLFFTHQYKPFTLSVPTFSTKNVPLMETPLSTKTFKLTGKTYAIQLGTFKYKSNLNKMHKSMETLIQNIEYTLINKEFKRDKGIIYKLYIGSFKSKTLARDTLKALKKEKKHGQILESAFIAELP